MAVNKKNHVNSDGYDQYFYSPCYKVENADEAVVTLHPNGDANFHPTSLNGDQLGVQTISDASSYAAMRKSQETARKRRRVFFSVIFLTLVLILTISIFILFILVLPHYATAEDSQVQYYSDMDNLSEIIQIPEIHFPIKYDLFFSIDLRPEYNKDYLMEGSVKIYLKTVKQADFILLHSENQVILNETKVYSSNGMNVQILNQTLDTTTNFYLIHLKSVLPISDSNILHIKFKSQISTMPTVWGVYTIDTSLERGVSTQFQPGWARMMFPCIDEPMYRSVYEIKVRHNQGYTALSNMPASKTHSSPEDMLDQFQITEFEPSPPMSSYLVALFVAPEEVTQSQSSFVFESSLDSGHTVDVGIYVQSPTYNSSDESIRMVIENTLLWCEKTFDAPYRLPKLDFVWVSHMALGMENWGLITMRENTDLTTTLKTLVHEILHQWLGNVASIEWWTDIWVVEALVTYLEHQIYEEMAELDKPAISMLLIEGFQTRDNEYALYPEITAPDSQTLVVQTFFHASTYQKGAWLYSGVDQLVGFEVIKNCARQYYNVYTNRHANMQQFLTLLTECTKGYSSKYIDEPIGSILMSWVEKGGMPIVHVSVTPDGKLHLTQGLSCKVKETEYCATSADSLWKIPVLITDFEGKKPKWEFLDEQVEMFYPGYDETSGFLVNYNMTFPYSVHYSAELWDHIIDAMESRVVDAIQAILIMGDVHNNVNSGLADITGPLKVFERFNRSLYEHYLNTHYFNRELLCILTTAVKIPPQLQQPLHRFFLSTADPIQLNQSCLNAFDEATTRCCITYFKMLCKQNLTLCQQLIEEVDDGDETFLQQTFHQSIIYTIVKFAELSNEEEKRNFISNKLTVNMNLINCVIDETLFEWVWNTFNFLHPTEQSEFGVSGQVIQNMLLLDPNLNEMFTLKYMSALKRRVFEEFEVNETNRIVYDTLSLVTSLLIETSEETKQVITEIKAEVKEKAEKLNSNIIPVTLNIHTLEMQQRNAKLLTDFLQKFYLND